MEILMPGTMFNSTTRYTGLRGAVNVAVRLRSTKIKQCLLNEDVLLMYMLTRPGTVMRLHAVFL